MFTLLFIEEKIQKILQSLVLFDVISGKISSFYCNFFIAVFAAEDFCLKKCPFWEAL